MLAVRAEFLNSNADARDYVHLEVDLPSNKVLIWDKGKDATRTAELIDLAKALFPSDDMYEIRQ